MELAAPLTAAVALLALALAGWLATKWYVRVPAGMALLVRLPNGQVKSSLTGQLVFPFVASAELIDLTTKRVVIQRQGRAGFRCRDRIRVSVTAHFLIAVNPVAEDMLKVAQATGAARAAEEGALGELLEGRFTQALATVIAALRYEELDARREEVTDRVLEILGTDLGGYVLRDAALVAVEQVPVEQLDPADLLDAEAIRTITERTAREAARRAEVERATRAQQAAQDREAEEVRARHERELGLLRAKHELEIEEAKREMERTAAARRATEPEPEP